MRRRLFNLLAALSLLAGIAVAGVWLRSYSTFYRFSWQGESWSCEVNLDLGTVTCWIRNGFHQFPAGIFTQTFENRSHGFGPSWWNRRGFRYEDYSRFGLWQMGATVPTWLYLLLTLPVPVAWANSRRKRLQRQRQGHCRQCGYDLQGLPGPRPRCPECGTENQLREEKSEEKPDADRAPGLRH